MVITRPPMGWNSWNTFASDINEKLIMDTADAMVREGLLECGYEYVVIDDCWSEKTRDKNGKLVPDPQKFPHGMKYLADYIHAKGLKFGMYSCAGSLTCAGYPGSYQHEFDDAASFAEWGVDFLKYDYCFHDKNVPGEVLYRRMGIALANCGRDILFSACSWGADNSEEWVKTTGAHMWRSTGDINDSWGSITSLTKKQIPLFKTNGHGCFNDMDMLVIGLSGKGNVAVKDSLLSFEEYQAHFSIWSLFSSPLMLGCDVRNMTEETKKIITNKEVIRIQQDAAARQVFLSKMGNEDTFFACRFLEDGDIAIGAINLADRPASRWRLTILLSEIGITRESGKTLLLRDLWTGEEYKVVNEIITADDLGGLPPHSARLFRAKVVDA